MSRIIDLSGGKWTGDNDDAVEQLMHLIATTLPKLGGPGEADRRTPLKTFEEVEVMHEFGA